VQDQVVGTLDERDAVNLEIAQGPDHGEHPCVGGFCRGCRKRASSQEQQSRFSYPDSWGVGMRIRHVIKLLIRQRFERHCARRGAMTAGELRQRDQEIDGDAALGRNPSLSAPAGSE
jgi:hypothetical protein